MVGGIAGIGRQAGSTSSIALAAPLGIWPTLMSASGAPVTIFNKRFSRQRTDSARQLPPGQALTADLSVPQARRTARIDLDDWRFTNRHEVGAQHGRRWAP
jgi:hypothetical protein